MTFIALDYRLGSTKPKKPRVYTASKLGQAPRWRDLIAERPDIEFTARWPHSHIDVPDTPDFASAFWLEDEQDVRRANAVLVYAEGDEHLRGALVEAGMGIAFRKHVVVVGEHPDYGTWQYHPSVYRVESIDAALDLIHRLHGTSAEDLAAWRAEWGEAAQ